MQLIGGVCFLPLFVVPMSFCLYYLYRYLPETLGKETHEIVSEMLEKSNRGIEVIKKCCLLSPRILSATDNLRRNIRWTNSNTQSMHCLFTNSRKSPPSFEYMMSLFFTANRVNFSATKFGILYFVSNNNRSLTILCHNFCTNITNATTLFLSSHDMHFVCNSPTTIY